MSSHENKISELYFLLHRNNINEIRHRLTNLLHTIVNVNNLCHLKTLYLLIGHTRDIYFGHGERDISYMMIYVWYQFFPTLAINAFKSFVIGCFPYGCWNDIKYFCKFISDISDKGNNDPLIDVAITCANNQLLVDYNAMSMSNISKWIPREKNNRWLFEKFVMNWFSNSNDCHDFSHKKKSYRQLISALSINQIQSQPTIKNIMQSCFTGGGDGIGGITTLPSYFHGNVFIGMYVKTAISIVKNCQLKGVLDFDTCPEAIWLNRKWCSLLASFSKCHDGIPLVDICADISNESLYHAIGFASLVAIKSGIFRIMLVSTTPIWIEFTKYDSICSFVDKIWSFCEFRSCSQFSFSFQLIMDGFSAIDFCPSMKLFVFSQRFLFDWNWIFHLSQTASFVFWNIGDFHICENCHLHINDNKNILFVSGFNACLFSAFCNSDILSVQSSYSFLLDSLYSDRHIVLANHFDSFFSASASASACVSS